MRGKLTNNQMKERLARRRKRRDVADGSYSTTRVPTRKEMRAIAKANMRKAGFAKTCKKDGDKISFFARNWREWAFKKIKMPKRRSA
jgi:hypothetical protein